MTEMTDRLTELRDLFVAKRGYWNDSWQFILDRDPEFFEGYLQVVDDGAAGAGRHGR
jgi:hypothetical protein